MKIVKTRLAIWTAVSMPDKAKPTDDDVKDKYSLKEQERLGILFGKEHDAEVVKIFRWPGHSRDESDIVQAMEDFAKAGRYEYHELREMWRAHAFDVLWCHSHSRLGRSFTLQSWVIENIIRSNARIYRHVGGWINREDYGGQIALGGYAGIGERERRISENSAGLTARAKKGLNLTVVPFPHRLIRDPKDGKAVLMEVDPANRLFLDHLYEILMDNTTMTGLGIALNKKYGHTNPRTGRAWNKAMIYEMLHRPSFWGHTARGMIRHKQSLYRDCWGFDLSAPIPEGVEMYRNTHEAAYVGKRADDVQSAIRHMKGLKGITRTQFVHSLSGLVFCPKCSHQMHYAHIASGGRKIAYLHCVTHYQYTSYDLYNDCANTKHIREEKLQKFISDILDRALNGTSLDKIFGQDPENLPQERIKNLEAEIKRQDSLIDNLRIQAAKLGDTTPRSLKLITDAETEFKGMEAELRTISQGQALALQQRERQNNALDKIRLIPPDQWWQMEGITFNRLLKDIFGQYAIFVLNGKILKTDLRPRRKRG